MKSRIIGWVLFGLACWVISSTGIISGSLLVHRLLQAKQHHTVITLHLSSTEWSQYANPKEINYRGNMFDVEKVSQDETGVTLWGHYDTKEDGLRQLEKKSHDNKHVLSYFFCFLFVEDFPTFSCYHQPVLKLQHGCMYSLQLHDVYLDIEIPPPGRS